MSRVSALGSLVGTGPSTGLEIPYADRDGATGGTRGKSARGVTGCLERNGLRVVLLSLVGAIRARSVLTVCVNVPSPCMTWGALEALQGGSGPVACRGGIRGGIRKVPLAGWARESGSRCIRCTGRSHVAKALVVVLY